MKYLVTPMQLGIVFSCILLSDAFRRLKQVQQNDQVISKKQVMFLSIAFGAFGLITLVELMTINNFLTYEIILGLWQFTFVLSCLLLAFILQSLIVMQAHQRGNYNVSNSQKQSESFAVASVYDSSA